MTTVAKAGKPVIEGVTVTERSPGVLQITENSDTGYHTDIARGSAKLVGIELVLNFRTPYFAGAPGDFSHR